MGQQASTPPSPICFNTELGRGPDTLHRHDAGPPPSCCGLLLSGCRGGGWPAAAAEMSTIVLRSSWAGTESPGPRPGGSGGYQPPPRLTGRSARRHDGTVPADLSARVSLHWAMIPAGVGSAAGTGAYFPAKSVSHVSPATSAQPRQFSHVSHGPIRSVSAPCPSSITLCIFVFGWYRTCMLTLFSHIYMIVSSSSLPTDTVRTTHPLTPTT